MMQSCVIPTPAKQAALAGYSGEGSNIPNMICRKTFVSQQALFSYIRLAASDIVLRTVSEANIISLKPSGFNITFTKKKYH